MVREIPLEVILSWPRANYEDPLVRGPAFIVLTGVLIVVVTIFVFFRLYVRIFMLKWFAADDIFILFSYVSATTIEKSEL
jgi:hypothetical protein